MHLPPGNHDAAPAGERSGAAHRSRTATRRAMLGVALLAAIPGCDREITTEYAAVRGPSINGISAFVQLLRDTGHGVTARQFLPSAIDPETASLVVFDDSFVGLGADAAAVLEEYLSAVGSRTLLLVLRDGDGAIAYLRDVLAAGGLSADRRVRAEELLVRFEATLAAGTSGPRQATPPFPDRLATVDRPAALPAAASTGPSSAAPAGPAAPPLEVTLSSRRGAARSRIPARWELHRRLEPGPRVETLWAAGREPLLVRRRRDDAVILVLASAAALVNGGLVDPGNRRLAEDLAALLPTDGRLLVAGSGRVAGRGAGGQSGGAGAGDDAAGDEEDPSLWRLLRIHPLAWVAAQAIATLALFGWCSAPIFGRPRRSSPTLAQDFGHHVEALAGLLARSPAAGAAFARERLHLWQRAVTSSRREPPAAERD